MMPVRECGHHIIYSKKGMDQPGKVANPARGRLNRENEYYWTGLNINGRESREKSSITRTLGLNTLANTE